VIIADLVRFNTCTRLAATHTHLLRKGWLTLFFWLMVASDKLTVFCLLYY